MRCNGTTASGARRTAAALLAACLAAALPLAAAADSPSVPTSNETAIAAAGSYASVRMSMQGHRAFCHELCKLAFAPRADTLAPLVHCRPLCPANARLSS